MNPSALPMLERVVTARAMSADWSWMAVMRATCGRRFASV